VRQTESYYRSYFRARYYDPTRSRFVSEDPIGLVAGINRLTYTSNNPLRSRDPLGLIEWPFDAPMPWNAGAESSPPLGLNGLFPYYGNWGAPLWSGGIAGGDVGPNPPVDSMDECFKAHDMCYGDRTCHLKQTAQRRNCDRRLLQCLSLLPKDSREWANPAPHPEYASAYRRAATAVFWLRARW
jgi:RHS repeat-associated protein